MDLSLVRHACFDDGIPSGMRRREYAVEDSNLLDLRVGEIRRPRRHRAHESEQRESNPHFWSGRPDSYRWRMLAIPRTSVRWRERSPSGRCDGRNRTDDARRPVAGSDLRARRMVMIGLSENGQRGARAARREEKTDTERDGARRRIPLRAPRLRSGGSGGSRTLSEGRSTREFLCLIQRLYDV